jgi:hypothetical protein
MPGIPRLQGYRQPWRRVASEPQAELLHYGTLLNAAFNFASASLVSEVLSTLGL